MHLSIPETLVHAMGLGEADLLAELALALYARRKLSMGQASRLARLSQAEFIDLMGERGVPLNYDLAEFREDVATLKRLGYLD